jgi:hypothetical protein
MDQEELSANSRSDDLAVPAHTKRRFLRTLAYLAAFVVVLFIIAGYLEISHYKPLELGGWTAQTADSTLSEPPGTFVVKYVVSIGNRGPASVQLTKVLPIKLGTSGQESMVTNAFLPTTNVYGQHHPFRPVTIAPGRYLEVGMRVTVRCFPLLAGNVQSIFNQSFEFKVLGFNETQSLSFSNSYPVTIVGPQNCKSKG